MESPYKSEIKLSEQGAYFVTTKTGKSRAKAPVLCESSYCSHVSIGPRLRRGTDACVPLACEQRYGVPIANF